MKSPSQLPVLDKKRSSIINFFLLKMKYSYIYGFSTTLAASFSGWNQILLFYIYNSLHYELQVVLVFWFLHFFIIFLFWFVLSGSSGSLSVFRLIQTRHRIMWVWNIIGNFGEQLKMFKDLGPRRRCWGLIQDIGAGGSYSTLYLRKYTSAPFQCFISYIYLGFFVYSYAPQPPLRGQHTKLCHPRWQPT